MTFVFLTASRISLSEFPYCSRLKVISKLTSKTLISILSFAFCILNLLKNSYVIAKVNPLLALCGVASQRTIKIHLFFLCFEMSVFQLLARGSLCKSSAEYMELGFCGQMKK